MGTVLNTDFKRESILRKLAVRKLRKSGYSSFTAPIVYKQWYEDIFENKQATLAQKLWAQKRGFLSNKISFYGLTEQNYTDYLSDFDYYWLHPINGSYSKWIDDKLTMKALLQPFSEYLPEYYYHIRHKEILCLLDCPDGFGPTTEGILDLLKMKRLLAAKLRDGSLGEGFYKLAYDGQDYFINNGLSKAKEVEELMGSWLKSRGKEYIITEYLTAHVDLGKIWSSSPNALRIMVVREKNKLPEIVISFIRFGINSTGVREDPAGIHCLVDLDTGRFLDGKIHTDFEMIESKYHPDSRVLVEGVIPYWSLVKEKILEISNAIPQVRYMGFDVIITGDGFKIIEINSHQGIDLIQYYQPLLKEGVSKDFLMRCWKRKKIYQGSKWGISGGVSK